MHFVFPPIFVLVCLRDPRHSMWTSVSRAVRMPSIRDRDLFGYFPIASTEPFPIEALVQGNTSIKSEVAMTYEAGYRQRVGKSFSADLAGFVCEYSKHRRELAGEAYFQTRPSLALIEPLVNQNDDKANSQG